MTSDAVQLEMLKILKEIKDDLKRKPDGDNNGGGNRKATKRRQDTSKYCWSCGAWNHLSKDCKRKKDGHQDDATFKNKKGGNTYCCRKA